VPVVGAGALQVQLRRAEGRDLHLLVQGRDHQHVSLVLPMLVFMHIADSASTCLAALLQHAMMLCLRAHCQEACTFLLPDPAA
jgi:hypothetical protein